ncbi:MAG: hypothetical protein JO011_03165 [Ktedonobacteraceae bacterium]|nr:hypothetical protein [Ktedonobacteraceae bacterium]
MLLRALDPYGDDWDYATGSLLIQEAGGIVANIGKESYHYQKHNFIAANRVIYEELTGGANPLFPIITPSKIQASTCQ